MYNNLTDEIRKTILAGLDKIDLRDFEQDIVSRLRKAEKFSDADREAIDRMYRIHKDKMKIEIDTGQVANVIPKEKPETQAVPKPEPTPTVAEKLGGTKGSEKKKDD